MIYPSFRYTYISGCAILALFWVIIYWKRRDLRKNMVWASLLGTPFGILDYLLVPNYWHPDSIFGLMPRFGVSIESFLFLFFMAGLSSVIYEYVFELRLTKLKGRLTHHYVSLVLSLLVFIIIYLIFPAKAIYAFMSAGLAGALSSVFLRKDLVGQMITASIIFTAFYFAVFILINMFYPGYVRASYNLNGIWGVYLFGFPIEELIVAFVWGGFWSTTYELVKGYRPTKVA